MPSIRWHVRCCVLKNGDVTLAEFNDLLSSPLSEFTVVGHPSWRNEASYLTVRLGRTVHVRNEGGRGHTFTEVAEFGGGRVPPLRDGLTVAPECTLSPGGVDPTALDPGDRLELRELGPGLHLFQCCIHPWMRAAIRVEGN
jgi:plastocyanin